MRWIMTAVLVWWFGIGAADGFGSSSGARQTLSLDGQWQIVFDHGNVGKQENWHKPAAFEQQPSRPIPVPSCWEEHEQDYEGVAWCARRFTAAAEWKDRHVRLRFDAVNYRAEVWLNGRPVGCHEGGYAPFEFDVTPWLQLVGQNTLIVRVVGPAVVTERVDTLVRNEAPHWRGAYVGGIWQSVTLIATYPTFVREIFVEPNLAEKTAVVHAEIENAATHSAAAEVTITVTPAAWPDQVVHEKTIEVTLPPGGQTLDVPLPIDKPVPWSPDNPHLYLARATITAPGRTLDTLTVRFGMRHFTIRDGDFHLNGKRLFIKGAFWEGLYPSTLSHPRGEAIVRREIRMAKEAGFNLLRPWRMPPAPLILDLADEMGILLVGSPAVECMGYWPAETPQMARRWTHEMVEMVRRDRNHPSIICWETANEIIRKSMLVHRHEVSLAARRVDPTRLIIDESGGSRAPWGAHAYLPHSTEPVPIIDRHVYRRSPLSASVYQQLAGHGEPGKLQWVSEVGYGGAPDLPRNCERYRAEGNPKTPDYRYHHALLESLQKILDGHGLRDLFGDVSAMCLATQELQAHGNKLQLEALRTNANCDGYCLHAYTAGDWVLGAGVLDVWREPKRMYDAAREVQQPLYLAVRTSPQNVYAERGAALTVTAVNDGPAVQADLDVTIVDPHGRASLLFNETVEISPGIHTLVARQLETASLRGPHTIRAALDNPAGEVTRNEFPLFVFGRADLKPGAAQVRVIEPRDRVREFLAGCGVACKVFDDGWGDTDPAVVAQPDAWNEKQAERFVRLMDWVGRGGVALWLTPPSTLEFHGSPIYRDYENNYLLRLRSPEPPRPERRNGLTETGIFPLKLRRRWAHGMWIPVGHYVRRHPIFDGLPSGGFMGQPYQNVAPDNTLTNLPGHAVAGSVSWDHHHDYRGPTEAWHGTDLAVVPHGKGKMILSTLQIVENLGKDPVADRLLLNMIRFADTLVGPLGPSPADLDRRVGEALARFRGSRADPSNAKTTPSAP